MAELSVYIGMEVGVLKAFQMQTINRVPITAAIRTMMLLGVILPQIGNTAPFQTATHCLAVTVSPVMVTYMYLL